MRARAALKRDGNRNDQQTYGFFGFLSIQVKGIKMDLRDPHQWWYGSIIMTSIYNLNLTNAIITMQFWHLYIIII